MYVFIYFISSGLRYRMCMCIRITKRSLGCCVVVAVLRILLNVIYSSLRGPATSHWTTWRRCSLSLSHPGMRLDYMWAPCGQPWAQLGLIVLSEGGSLIFPPGILSVVVSASDWRGLAVATLAQSDTQLFFSFHCTSCMCRPMWQKNV